MIRPITLICWILALGAGLYFYRAKHEVELMDKHIEQVARETSDVRADSRRMLDDWLRLGEPEQLHKYSDEYLGLKTIAPTQFARLSDLPSRLPAPQADPPDQDSTPVAESPDTPPPGVQSAMEPNAAGADTTDEPGADDLPVPPIPPTVPVLTTVVLPAVATVPLQARPVTPRATTAPSQPRPPEPRVADEPLGAPRMAPPLTPDEPRQTVASRPASPYAGQPGPRDRGLPPLQAQMGQGQLASIGTPRQEQIQETKNQDGSIQQAQTRGWRTQAWQNQAGQNQGDQTRAEPAPPGLEARGTPPRRQSPDRGLLPLQAQGTPPVQGSGQSYSSPVNAGPAYTNPANSGPAGSGPRYASPSYASQPVGRTVPWSAPSQATETRVNDPRMRPPPPQFGDPRGPQMTQQAPMPAGSGSLLGMPRGPVPLPLPAPTPVSATWAAPAGSGR